MYTEKAATYYGEAEVKKGKYPPATDCQQGSSGSAWSETTDGRAVSIKRVLVLPL
jgi:hypothetical protein